MKQQYRLILFLCVYVICIKGVCQPVIQCEQFRREIRFINLQEKSNESFRNFQRDLSTIVLSEVQKGNLQPLFIDYSSAIIKAEELDKDAFQKRLIIKFDSEFQQEIIFPNELTIIGMDQTVGLVNGKEYSQVHYVNFYAHDDILNNSKDGRYCFSLNWQDFIILFIEKKNYLYSTNSYGSWWRGDVFVTQQYYAVDKGTCGEFIQLAQSDSTFKAFDYKNTAKTYDLSAFKEVSYIGYPFDLRIIEHQHKRFFEIDTILFQTISDHDPYKSTNQIAFAWNSFLQVAAEKDWHKNSSILRMSDAILLQKFHYSTSIPNEVISTNGLFANGYRDSLSTIVLTNSFYMSALPERFDYLQMRILEGIYLSDPHNSFLHKPEHDLVEIIYENVLNGKLKAFINDAMLTEVSPSQVRLNAHKIIDIPEYEFNRKYRKGAIFSLNYQDSLTHNYEIQYYQVKKRFKSSLDLPAKKFNAKTVVYETPIYTAAQLDVIELIQQITFNSEGKNKQYHLQGIGIKVPADIDVRGVEYPIAYVRWEDLKKILLSDPRATIVYQTKQTNLVDLMENRFFQSVFYKSDNIEPRE